MDNIDSSEDKVALAYIAILLLCCIFMFALFGFGLKSIWAGTLSMAIIVCVLAINSIFNRNKL